MTDQTTEQKRHFLVEAIGWYGVIALLVAFALQNFGIISSENVCYQILNITGAVGIVIDALSQKNWQPAALNIIWALVGAIALVRIFI